MATKIKLGTGGNWGVKENGLLAYNDEDGIFKAIEMDFSRSSTATRESSTGLITDSPIDTPRIDFTDDSDGALLLEPQSTNLITYSEEFTQWTASNLTVTDNNLISPDGSLNASKLTLTSGTSTKRIALGSMPTSSATRSYSILCKTNDINSIQLLHSGDLQGYANFDLVNGVVGTSGSKTTNTIQDYGNGWYRCTAIFDNTNVFGSTLYLYIEDNASGTYGGSTSQVGDLFIYGAQYEELPYPTSYIPTSGATATRIAETCSKSGLENYINSSEGVLYVEMSALADDVTTRRIALSDGTASNVVRISYEIANNRIYAVLYNGANQAVLNYSSVDITQFSKIAFKFKENDFALWVDGVERQTDSSGTTFTSGTLTRLGFDRGDGGSDFYGKIKDLRVYDQELSDEELQNLTTL